MIKPNDDVSHEYDVVVVAAATFFSAVIPWNENQLLLLPLSLSVVTADT